MFKIKRAAVKTLCEPEVLSLYINLGSYWCAGVLSKTINDFNSIS